MKELIAKARRRAQEAIRLLEAGHVRRAAVKFEEAANALRAYIVAGD